MKLFKNRKQLYKFFFESTYNRENITDSITYDKKIIVIEDIDCLGDIVLQRKQNENNEKINDITTTMLQTLIDNSEKDKTSDDDNFKTSSKSFTTDPITLDDILNIWDGIQEQSGRIMIITSNHYDKLDPALTRPGRIDIKLEMSKLSNNSTIEIYKHLYDTNIPRNMINKLPNYKYTPAEIMNIYLNNQYDKKQFLNQLCSHKIE